MRRLSLRKKAAVMILIISFILAGSSVLISYRTYSETMDEHYKRNAMNIARTAATQMDPEKIRKYVETLEKDEDYDTYFQILKEIRLANEVADLYVQTVSAEGCTYIINEICPLGQTDPLAEANFQYLDRLEEGLPAFITYSQYGWLCSAGAPIIDDNGEVVAMALVDVSMDEVMQDRQQFLVFSCVMLVSITLLITVIIIILVNQALVNPIKELAGAASSFISDRSKKSGKEPGISAITKLDIRSGDEVEDLSHAIKEMERDIITYIQNLTQVTAEKERISAELNVATQIQGSMLPSIFPAFPGHDEFDIYATMDPAKEVGGDFYDFFMVDENHLGVVIADVSGKGVPAALFMVITKTLIKNHALSGESPAEIFTSVNTQLCENNEAGMFVTGWLGFINLHDGKMIYVNAGHNYPLVKYADGSVAWLKTRPGFVLAGMEGVHYRQNEFQFDRGDTLYLYTDGVTEALNEQQELFGDERLEAALNASQTIAMLPEELLRYLKIKVDEFAGNAEQADDITMLAVTIREEA